MTRDDELVTGDPGWHSFFYRGYFLGNYQLMFDFLLLTPLLFEKLFDFCLAF